MSYHARITIGKHGNQGIFFLLKGLRKMFAHVSLL